LYIIFELWIALLSFELHGIVVKFPRRDDVDAMIVVKEFPIQFNIELGTIQELNDVMHNLFGYPSPTKKANLLMFDDGTSVNVDVIQRLRQLKSSGFSVMDCWMVDNWIRNIQEPMEGMFAHSLRKSNELLFYNLTVYRRSGLYWRHCKRTNTVPLLFQLSPS